MKSEHRHELKTNDLAKSLFTFQDYARAYGGKVLLGLAIVILGIVLIVQRVSSSRAAETQIRNDLAYVRTQIERLNHVNVTPDGRASVQPSEVSSVVRILQDVRDKASDKAVLAAAAVAQGDYNWALANYPEVPAAATRPSLKPDRPAPELLKAAQDAYKQVVSEYPDQKLSVTAAHFGLAAVAENQSNWDEAKREYDAIIASADPKQGFKALAEDKLKRLDDLRRPLLVGKVPDKAEKPELDFPELANPPIVPPTTAATTAPAPTTRPAAKPTVAPTTRPSKATTKPTK
jgi:hypothetical protein